MYVLVTGWSECVLHMCDGSCPRGTACSCTYVATSWDMHAASVCTEDIFDWRRHHRLSAPGPSIIIEDSMATSFRSTSRFSQSKYSLASFWEASKLGLVVNPSSMEIKHLPDPFRKTSASNRTFAHSQKQHLSSLPETVCIRIMHFL